MFTFETNCQLINGVWTSLISEIVVGTLVLCAVYVLIERDSESRVSCKRVSVYAIPPLVMGS